MTRNIHQVSYRASMLPKLFFMLVAILGVSCQSGSDAKSDLNQEVKGEDSSVYTATDTIAGECYYTDTTIIAGEIYQFVLDKDSGVVYVMRQADTVFKLEDGYGVLEHEEATGFFDFNEDGYDDVYINYVTNVPGVQNVALFDPGSKTFNLVLGLRDWFPASVHLTGDYYYSYSRAGCADWNWESYLFKIKNYSTVPLGLIEGDGCDSNKIEVYRVLDGDEDKRKLVETFPIDTIDTYESYKWGFIEDYWRGHYKSYTR